MSRCPAPPSAPVSGRAPSRGPNGSSRKRGSCTSGGSRGPVVTGSPNNSSPRCRWLPPRPPSSSGGCPSTHPLPMRHRRSLRVPAFRPSVLRPLRPPTVIQGKTSGKTPLTVPPSRSGNRPPRQPRSPNPPAPSSPPSPASPRPAPHPPGHARRTGPARLRLVRGRSHPHRRPHPHPARPPRRRHPRPPPRRPSALPAPGRPARAHPGRPCPGLRAARSRTPVRSPRRSPRMRGRPRTGDTLPADRRRNPLPTLSLLIAGRCTVRRSRERSRTAAAGAPELTDDNGVRRRRRRRRGMAQPAGR